MPSGEWRAHRVVGWQVRRLVGGKVRQEQPVPGGDQDVLALDVPVADALLVALRHRMQQLERDPVLQCRKNTDVEACKLVLDDRLHVVADTSIVLQCKKCCC